LQKKLIGEKRLLKTGVEKLLVKLYNFFEIFGFLEVCIQSNPILFDDFFGEIIDETFDKIDDFIVCNVGNFKTLYI
jgi:hypothetical protein